MAAVANVLIKADPQREWLKPSPSRISQKTGKPSTRRIKAERLEDDAWAAVGKPPQIQTMTPQQAQQSGFQVDAEKMVIVTGAVAPGAPQTAPAVQPTPQQPPAVQPAVAQPAAPQMPMAPQPPQSPAPVAPQPAPPAGVTMANVSPDATKLDTIIKNQEMLAKKLEGLTQQLGLIDMALAWKLRKETGTGGACTCEAFLRDLSTPSQ
jgi:hypothetical protein